MYAHEPQFYQQESQTHPQRKHEFVEEHHFHHTNHLQQEYKRNQPFLLSDQSQQDKFPPPFYHQQQLLDQHHLEQLSLERQQYGHNGVYEMAMAAPTGQVHHVPETEEPYGFFASATKGPEL